MNQIELSDLPRRAKSACEAQGIRTFAELAKHTEKELRRLPNCGKASVAAIKAELANHGLTLAAPPRGRTKAEEIRHLRDQVWSAERTEKTWYDKYERLRTTLQRAHITIEELRSEISAQAQERQETSEMHEEHLKRANAISAKLREENYGLRANRRCAWCPKGWRL